LTFLNEIATILIRDYGSDFSNIEVVLPSKRAGLFLKKHLSDQLKKSFFPPQIVTLTELFSRYTPLHIGDPAELLFVLYEAYSEIEKEKAESFDRFLRWGNMLLTDYNDIDRYLIDPKLIFRDLRNIKTQEMEIEAWSFEEGELSQNQERYLEFWLNMQPIYEVFRRRLKEKSIAYSGMLYRDVAEHISEVFVASEKKFLIAGFNAFSASEQKIIEWLIDQDIARIYFDGDPYYIDDPNQEAGLFLRRMKKQWEGKGFELVKSHFAKGKKSIHVLNAPGNVAQARIAGQVLSEAGTADTAIVLANEQLLLPVLNSLPVTVDRVNVTMGFPLRNSDLFQLYYVVLDLQQARKDENGKDKGGFYYRPFIEFLFHPIIRNYLGQEAEQIRLDITERKRIFIADKNLNEYAKGKFSFIHFLVEDWKNFPVDAMSSFERLNEILREEYLHIHPDKLALEYVYHMSSAMDKLRSMLQKYPLVKEFHSFRTLLRQYVSQLDISFVGEPLDGLQLMGVLETRSLDFKKVIMLSVNEDVLPKSRWEHSFILHEVKKYHGLPTYKDKDAVYANHFYRLLQRCDEAWLVYNSDPESLSSGEKSRFVQQLTEELPAYNPEVSITEKTVRLKSGEYSGIKSVEKTEEVLQRIRQHLENGISPSALNTYLNCSLDYYYKYILSIKEQEELDEVSDNAIVGNVVHHVMEHFYKDFIGKQLQVQDIDTMLNNYPETALRYLKQEAGSAQVDQGNYLLLYQVSLSILEGLLKMEREVVRQHELIILGIEEDLGQDLNTPHGVIRIKGKADRIDLLDGQVRIIDYKTGKFEARDVHANRDKDLGSKPKALQLLAYAWCYQRNHPEVNIVQSGIYPLLKKEELCLLTIEKNANLQGEDWDFFETEINRIVAEMLDPNVSFTHTEASTFCILCD